MRYFCLLVVGSRSITDYELIKKKLDVLLSNVVSKYQIMIVSGGARGVDMLAERYARERGYLLKVFKLRNGDWHKINPNTGKVEYDKSAGYKRNREMHSYIAQFENRGVVVFWDGKSKGSLHSVDLAKEYENPIRLIKVEKDK